MDSKENGSDFLRDNSVPAPLTLETPPSEDIIYPNAIRTACVSLGVALSLTLVGLDMTIVATAIPRITEDFPGVNLIGWYSSAFFVAMACFQPFWGKIYPNFSIKYVFLITLFIFSIGALIGGLAPNSTIFILGRALMGASAAGIASGGYAILGVTVHPRLRPIFTGFVTTTYSVANVLGPILGGFFSQKSTWRWCFYVNLPVAAASAITILLFFHPPARLPERNKRHGGRLSFTDLMGMMLALAALVCFTRAVEVAGVRKAWASAEVVGLLIGAAVAALAFVVLQAILGDRALLVTPIMKQRVVYMGMLYGFFHEGAFYLLLYYVPIYFQVVVGLSSSDAGIRNLPLLISCGIGSTAAGFLVSKFGYYTPLMVWASSGGCIGAALLCTLNENSGPAQWIGYQVLSGLALGSGMPLGIIAGQAKSKVEDLPLTTAILLFTFCIGTSASLGTGQSVLGNLILLKLPTLSPGVNPIDIVTTGATEIRNLFPADEVPGIVAAYAYGIRAVFVTVAAYAGTAIIFASLSKWDRLGIE